jgi:hypothetical protein
MQPWRILDHLDTADGRLELRRRGERDFLITIAGRVLMTSAAHRSEEQLARAALAKRACTRVLLGGLGMGYTLRATLDLLPRSARIVVAELNARVIDWCRGPLAALTRGAAADRRVQFVVDDVARVIATSPAARHDAIILDLHEGPHETNNRGDHPLYGKTALERARAALSPAGVLAIWSEEPDAAFEARFTAAGFRVERQRCGRGGRRHVVYLGTPAPDRGPPRQPGRGGRGHVAHLGTPAPDRGPPRRPGRGGRGHVAHLGTPAPDRGPPRRPGA